MHSPDIQIPFNKPYLSGKELHYIEQAVRLGKISGDGEFTKRCQLFLQQQLGVTKTLLTTSCTAALEMAALLLRICPGDEVIMPSFTFVSTANAFVLRGARIVFADSTSLNPNLDTESLEALITPRTRAIVPVHYAGIACDMDAILRVAHHHQIAVVEDAAQAIDSYYKGKPLGSFGELAAFSFHETKNIISGEGGLLALNSPEFSSRAEILWEKGTNRYAFFRNEVAKYNWVDIGSSFLPSDIIAAFLYAQLENLQTIQQRRRELWNTYSQHLAKLALKEVGLPTIPEFATNNGHLFYLVCRSGPERTALLHHLRGKGILAVFHYQPLHSSPYYQASHDGRSLPWTDLYADCLLRLPLYYELEPAQQHYIIEEVLNFYR